LQQTLLKNDQFIPEMKNEDPADLARTASVTASSTAMHKEFSRADVVMGRSNASDERWHELTMPRAVILPAGLVPRVDSVLVYLRSSLTEPVELAAHLRGAASAEAFSEGKDLATASATVKPGERWVRFNFKTTVSDPFLGVWLSPVKGVSWTLMEKAPAGSGRAYGGAMNRPWTVRCGEFYAVATEPPRAFALDVRPEKIVDGTSRIVGSDLHLWSSDPKQPLPQWIELDLGSARKVNTVQVTFDTDMNVRWPARPLAKQCVRDYEVLCEDGKGGWQTVAVVKDNFQRWRVHRFPATSIRKIRVKVLATHGDPAARIFEVRAYAD
jgi:hypothetical protein